MACPERPVAFLTEVLPKDPINGDDSHDDKQYCRPESHCLPFFDFDCARPAASAQRCIAVRP